jgi:hypothetical protein
MKERRRHPRVTLRKPILASVENMPVFVLDVSRGGLRVAHRSQLPPPGATCQVDLPLESGQVSLDCAVVRTAIQHATAAAETLFNSGLSIVAVESASRERYEKLLSGNGRRGGRGKGR